VSCIDVDVLDQLTIVGGSAEYHRNVCGAAVAFGDDELLCVDDAAILNNIAGDRSIVLNRLSIDCLQACNLRINGGLVAAQSLEDLLTSNCVGLVDSVVRAVGGTVVAIETESAASTEVALRNCSCDQVLVDDSRRAEKSTNRSCTSAFTDL
jgi:hypothetical protein